jgi:hypothetical protein
MAKGSPAVGQLLSAPGLGYQMNTGAHLSIVPDRLGPPAHGGRLRRALPRARPASQGGTIETTCDNLREALKLFFECASPSDLSEQLGEDTFVTQIEVNIG